MGKWVEAVIAADAAINAESDTLEVVAPTSLTTRTGRGRPKITHFHAFTSTDDVARVWALPAGYADPNGIPCESVSIYGATANFDPEEARLPVPIELPENCAIQIWAQSETAANTVVIAWMLLEYPTEGPFEAPANAKGVVRRVLEHGAALVSNVVANSTVINDLQPDKTYHWIGVGCAGINGETAGCVGPLFAGPAANLSSGAEFFVPVPNNGGYVVGGGPSYNDFKRTGILPVKIKGGQPLQMRMIGYTAEQPQCVMTLAVDKV
ncbi:MAG: hypothetical protein WC551_13935 [Patescibacteria group bacterium]